MDIWNFQKLQQEADEVFQKNTTTPQTDTNTDILTTFKESHKLLKKQLRTVWEISSIQNYQKEKITPRGLRIQIIPSAHLVDIDFSNKWLEIVNKCSQDLMTLILEKEKNNLEILNTQVQLSHTKILKLNEATEFQMFNTRLNEQLERYKHELSQRKHMKFFRDKSDFEEKRAYKIQKTSRNPTTADQTDVSSSEYSDQEGRFNVTFPRRQHNTRSYITTRSRTNQRYMDNSRQNTIQSRTNPRYTDDFLGKEQDPKEYKQQTWYPGKRGRPPLNYHRK